MKARLNNLIAEYERERRELPKNRLVRHAQIDEIIAALNKLKR